MYEYDSRSYITSKNKLKRRHRFKIQTVNNAYSYRIFAGMYVDIVIRLQHVNKNVNFQYNAYLIAAPFVNMRANKVMNNKIDN